MSISPVGVGQHPFFTKNEVKNEAKCAAISAALSGGVTYALNTPRNAQFALKAGAIGAGLSLAVGIVSRALEVHKINKAEKEQYELMQKQSQNMLDLPA